MANWKYKLDFSHWYHDDEIPINGKAELAVKEIDSVLPHNDLDLEMIRKQFVDFAENMSESDVDDFDDIMEQLYDWGDQEVEPYGKWPPNKMCWVNTIKKGGSNDTRTNQSDIG